MTSYQLPMKQIARQLVIGHWSLVIAVVAPPAEVPAIATAAQP
jgi:hypothetical protein